MNKNIRDYMSNSKDKQPNIGANSDGSTQEDLQRKVNNYSRMSENDLAREMNRLALEGRADGTINEQSLQAFYTQVAPMLTIEQRNKLKHLINTLKN